MRDTIATLFTSLLVLSVVITLVLYYIFTNFLVVVLPKGRWINIAF